MEAVGVTMRYHPILFSDESVRAILAGRKTQTRRVVLEQPEVGAPLQRLLPYKLNTRQYWGYGTANGKWLADDRIQCPYGQPGDRLWVREVWQTSVGADDKPGSALETPGNGYGWPVWYAADQGAVTWRGAEAGGPSFTTPGRYRTARFMPRWASRITLEVTGVRVERVQEIRGMDAKREGASVPAHMPHDGADCDWAMRWFRESWDHINAKRGYGWDANPWVWVVEFRRVEA